MPQIWHLGLKVRKKTEFKVRSNGEIGSSEIKKEESEIKVGFLSFKNVPVRNTFQRFTSSLHLNLFCM